jgi:hypothetical protein
VKFLVVLMAVQLASCATRAPDMSRETSLAIVKLVNANERGERR